MTGSAYTDEADDQQASADDVRIRHLFDGLWPPEVPFPIGALRGMEHGELLSLVSTLAIGLWHAAGPVPSSATLRDWALVPGIRVVNHRNLPAWGAGLLLDPVALRAVTKHLPDDATAKQRWKALGQSDSRCEYLALQNACHTASRAYLYHHRGTTPLDHDLEERWAALKAKYDPFARLGSITRQADGRWVGAITWPGGRRQEWYAEDAAGAAEQMHEAIEEWYAAAPSDGELELLREATQDKTAM